MSACKQLSDKDYNERSSIQYLPDFSEVCRREFVTLSHAGTGRLSDREQLFR